MRRTGVGRAFLVCALGLLAASPALASEPSARNPILGVPEAPTTGIKVARKNVVWGKARKCTAPAEIDMKKAIEATPEGKEIKDKGIGKGSAKYMILMSKANKRVRRHVKTVAVDESRDCVVKKDTIKENPNKLEVVDLTDKVVEAIENE